MDTTRSRIFPYLVGLAALLVAGSAAFYSVFGLSKLSGLSKSYLNEIEKGKKYPKPDKIAILSEKLDVPYDQFVSLKLDKNLAPIGDILKSKILKEIPLDLFGIKESNLIEIIANAPAKNKKRELLLSAIVGNVVI